MIETAEEKPIAATLAVEPPERADRESAELRAIRQSAFEHFSRLGFPTTQLEEWQYTNLGPLARLALQPASPKHDLQEVLLDRVTLRGSIAAELVFVDGHFARELSALGEIPEGVRIENFDSLSLKGADLLDRHLARYADYREHAMRALNTAYYEDGVVIALDDHVRLERPIHISFVATAKAEPSMISPRVLVVAGRDSGVTVAETYCGSTGTYFTNAVTEIVAGENAAIDHYRVLREGGEAFHIGTLQIEQAANSNVRSHSLTFSARLARIDVNVRLNGQGSSCTLDGLYVARGTQHVDHHTVIEHLVPHCESFELYKGVLDDSSRGVFDGKIVVHKDAQKTSSRQTNKNLLLTRDAIADSKPQLVIHADDVKCNHGSTIGQIDDKALFYLQSRGIGLQKARELLTYGFASEVIGRIGFEALRVQVEGLLLERLPGGFPAETR